MILKKYLIFENATLFECLGQLNDLKTDLNLFVVDKDNRLLGSVTDGDIRRGILKGVTLNDTVKDVMNKSCIYLNDVKIDLDTVSSQRKNNIKILPLLNEQHQVVDLLNFNKVRTLLPVDAVVMAGGTGTRLLPLTKNTPKPMLQIGDKPIIEYNLDLIGKYGIRNIFVTVNYLKEQIQNFIQSHPDLSHIKCIEENFPLGTIGSLSLIDGWKNDFVLLMNSDLLTNIDYEDFFLAFRRSGADMMVAAISYPIQVPYAILETDGKNIKSFKEKPDYIYYANTGIYLIKRELLDYIPKNIYFDATHFMERLLENGKTLSYYQITGYWLDIGKHEDFKKAQEDIKHLKF